MSIHYLRVRLRTLTILFGICAYSCFLPSDINAQKKKYFNEENKEISKKQFKNNLNSRNYFEIPTDSVYIKKLIARAQSGHIENISLLYSTLEVGLNQKLDRSKPLIIIYYPGLDKCNSGGSQRIAYFENWYDELETGIFQISQTKPIYIYKESEGLEKYGNHMVWHKDPFNIIEKNFFKYSFPCNSFVVISKQGQYESYFGEFPKEYVWKACQFLAR